MDTNDNEWSFLTIDELRELDTLLISKGIRTDQVDVGPLNRVNQPIGDKTLLVLELEGRVKLSRETKKLERERMYRAARKRRALRFRKPYTRKPGTVHPKRKEATERRRRARQWASDPFVCILNRNRMKCKRLDQDSWKRLIDPLWTRYDPKDLSIVFPRRSGTRADPWTLYNMTVLHTELGVVYDGRSQELFDLSDSSLNTR